MSILVARKLGTAAYGTFAVYWYGTWMLSQVADLGLHLNSLRALSRRHSPTVLRTAVAAKAVLTASALLVLTVALAARSSSWVWPLALLLLTAHLAGSWVEFGGVVLRSRNLVAREGVLLAVLRTGWLLGALWALSQSENMETLGWALALMSIPALVMAAAFVRRRFSWGRANARLDVARLIRTSFPLALAGLVTLTYLRADLMIVAWLRGSSEAGIFQAAFRLFEATFVISGGIAAGTFPVLAARIGTERFDALCRSLVLFLAGAGAVLTALFALGADPLVTLLFGHPFRSAATPLAILGLALVPVFVNALTTHLLIASGRARRLVLCLCARLVTGVSLDLALVPTYGASGAALAVVAAESGLLILSAASVFHLLWPAQARVAPCS